MASSLAAQLRTIVLAQGGSAPRQLSKGRPSLLFDSREAADIDLQTVFNIAQTGLNELSTSDGRFEPFFHTLFGYETLQLDRELQPPDVNKKLDSSIAAYMQLLSGYLLLTPAHQTLEYLIRRYKVQQYNVDAVMAAILPYHDTNLFVRILQLLHIWGTKWQFLEGVQTSGAAVPREVLALRCSSDMALLGAVCDMARAASAPAARGHTTLAFCAVLLMEALAAAPTVSDALVNALLPFLLDALHRDRAHEYQAGGLMVMAQLANRATLSQELLAALFEALAKAVSAPGAMASERLMLLLQLTQTQPVSSFPLKAFYHLVKFSELAPTVAELSRRFNTSRFLGLLLHCLALHSVKHANYEETLLQFIQSVPMETHVGALVADLLALCFPRDSSQAPAADSATKGVVTKMLRALDRRYPAQLDAAVNSALEEVAAAQKEGGKKTKKKKKKPQQQQEEEGEEEEKGEQEGQLLEFLQVALAGSCHAPLASSQATLYLSIDHPQARVREAAVGHLAATALSALSSGDEHQVVPFARGALLRRLQDDDWGVVLAALAVPSLPALLPAASLLQALSALLPRASAALSEGPKAVQQSARGVLKRALKLLQAAEGGPQPGGALADSAPLLLLDFLLVSAKMRKVNRAAIKVAASLSSPLFAKLPPVAAQLEQETAGDDETASSSKEAKELQDARVSDRMVAALAEAVVDDPGATLPLYARALEGSRAGPGGAARRSLALLVVLRALSSASPEALPGMMSQHVVPLLQREWHAAEASDSPSARFAGAELDQVDSSDEWAAGAPPQHVYAALSRDLRLYPQLLLRVLGLVVANIDGSPSPSQHPGSVGNVLETLFLLLASSSASSSGAVERHLAALLQRLPPASVAPFLARHITADSAGVPAGVQVRSLGLLKRHLAALPAAGKKARESGSSSSAQEAVVPLLYALCSPLKAVRRGALACLSAAAENIAATLPAASAGKPGGEAAAMRAFLQALLEAKEVLLSDARHLAALLASLLGEAPQTGAAADRLGGEGARTALLRFLLSRALALSSHARLVLVAALAGAGHSADQAAVSAPLLAQLLQRRREQHLDSDAQDAAAMAGGDGSGRLSQQDVDLLVLLLQMYTPEVAGNITGGSGGHAQVALEPLLAALQVGRGRGHDDAAVTRPAVAAACCLSADFYGALSEATQGRVFGALLTLAGSDAGDAVRAAAADGLRACQVSASTVSRHLELCLKAQPAAGGVEETAGGKGRKKKRKGEKEDPAGGVASAESASLWPDGGAGGGQLIPSTTTLLEVLLWKDNIPERQALVAPLQALLLAIVESRWPPAAAMGAAAAAAALPPVFPAPAGGEDLEESAEAEAAATGQPQASLALTYIHQLLLMVLASIAAAAVACMDTQDDGELASSATEGAAGGFDAELTVRCVTSAQDSATRNHAIALLTSVAELCPQQVLEHVLTILRVVGSATLSQDDSASHRAVQAMLAAVLPPWLAHNQQLQPLLQVFVDVLPQVPVQRRMSLVTAVLRVVGEARALPVLLLLLLTADARGGPSGKTPGAAAAGGGGMGAKHGQVAAAAAAAAGGDGGAWGAEFASQLCGHFSVAVRLPAFVGLLEATRAGSAEASGGAVKLSSKAAWRVQAAAAQFVAQQLQLRSFWESPHEEEDEDGEEGGGGAEAQARAAALQAGYVGLLEQVLLRLRAPGGSSAGDAAHRGAAIAAAYALLGVLNDLMAPAAYLQGIAALLSHPDTFTRRKVLRLVTAKLREESESARLSGRHRRRLKERQLAAAQSLNADKTLTAEESALYAELAAQISKMLAGAEEDSSSSTKLAALQALDVLVCKYGADAPRSFAPSLPPVVECLQRSSSRSRAVAAAAARCVAAFMRALGPAALPQLSSTVSVLLQASLSAVEALPLTAAEPRSGGLSSSAGAGDAAEAEDMEEETDAESEEEEEEQGTGADGKEEEEKEEDAQAGLAAELLGAVEGLVAAMGPFLSPYLGSILDLVVLRARVHLCSAAGVSQKAAAVRELLAEKIPARLLLEPLFGAYERATAAGVEATAALLGLLGSLAARLDPKAVAQYHTRIFDFLLRTLDLRRQPPPSFSAPAPAAPSASGSPGGGGELSPQAEAQAREGGARVVGECVEPAAVGALGALVMKLSENAFKPLFVQLLDWAHTEVVDGQQMPAGGSTERHIVLFGIVNVLSQKLRSVFVPYFRFLLDACILHLTGTQAAPAADKDASVRPKKKKQKKASGGAREAGGVGAWVLRYLVLQALHKCFLYDSVAFLDAPRFQRILEPITSQIEAEPPAGIQTVGAAAEEEGAYLAACVPSRTMFDRALVACLGQMALTANSDALWKPLNYQVLMYTRRDDVRARGVGLDIVKFLIDHLKEEYLVLLPETIPFLAELLEDADLAIVAKTQELIKALEQLSGEDLTQYF